LPIFPHRFTFRRPFSDAYKYSRCHFSTTANCASNQKVRRAEAGLKKANSSQTPYIPAARLAAAFWRSPTVAQSKTATKSPKKASTRSGNKASRAAELGEVPVTIDRRRNERREVIEENAEAESGLPKLERRKKVNRRRQIDPTTCERDYSEQEVEFMNALDDYKRKSGRMFPTCSEVLEVIQSLGYAKISQPGYPNLPATDGISAKPMPAELPTWGTTAATAETI
jgi:hypothetical protein